MAELERLWRHDPECRFGQLIMQSLRRQPSVSADVDVATVSDDELLGAISACWVEESQRPPYATPGPYWDTEGRPKFEKGRPRDPARIQPLLETLGGVWHAHPELSLGAILAAAVGANRLAAIEDRHLRRRLERVGRRPASVVGSMLQHYRAVRVITTEHERRAARPEDDMGPCDVCRQRPAIVVCGSWLGKLITLGYCQECRRRRAEPRGALEMRAASIGWQPFASGVDRITTFHDGRYMSFREALHGTPRGRQLDALRGDGEIRLWVDDDLVERGAREGWIHVTTAREAIELLATGRVVEISLDYDLGQEPRSGRGIDVVDWLAEQQEAHGRVLWPRDGITLHTANPAGRMAMAQAIEHYAAKHLQVRRSLTTSGKPRFTFLSGTTRRGSTSS